MKIYTRQGDDGSTGLYGGDRVLKNDLRVEAYGTVDELNATLGWAAVASSFPEISAILCQLQELMFTLGADLCTPDRIDSARQPVRVTMEHVTALEEAIDRTWAPLPELRSFVLPGGCELAARLHVARTVSRRAERTLLPLHAAGTLPAPALPLMNRVSDLLFALARRANQLSGAEEILWEGKARLS